VYALPNIIKVIKSRRMRWAEHTARMGEVRNAYSVLIERPEERDHSEDLGVNGKLIL
jgi:hypothetical protein